MFSFLTGIASSQNFSLPGGESLGDNKDLKCHPHQKDSRSPGVCLCWGLYSLMGMVSVLPKLLVGREKSRGASGNPRSDGEL